MLILILMAVFALGASFALQSFTIVDWWKPMIVCAAIAAIATFPLGKLLCAITESMFRRLRYAATFVLIFSILLCAFYVLNYHFADESTRIVYTAQVVRKYSEERTRSSRSGRRGYGVEKYNVHFIEIELRDGSTKKMERPLNEYLKIKKGGHVTVTEEEGLFGIKVIKLNHRSKS
ncbi:MAG: hypothetical protein K2K37_03935 [Muribaculaceae bacterium]|nr:hypothetical protein [Muribaculaceae bacterium]